MLDNPRINKNVNIWCPEYGEERRSVLLQQPYSTEEDTIVCTYLQTYMFVNKCIVKTKGMVHTFWLIRGKEREKVKNRSSEYKEERKTSVRLQWSYRQEEDITGNYIV